MSEDSFNKLVDLLRPMIAIDQRQSMRSTQGAYPITPEITVGAGLRYLGGGAIHMIGDSFNCSESSIQRHVDSFLRDSRFRVTADDWLIIRWRSRLLAITMVKYCCCCCCCCCCWLSKRMKIKKWNEKQYFFFRSPSQLILENPSNIAPGTLDYQRA